MTALVVVICVAFVGVQNWLVGRFVAGLPRLSSDFSATYIDREIRQLASDPPQALFLGDSVLWGFGLPADETAISVLRARGCACANLAFKAGSPPNFYALARLLAAAHVHPGVVVLEINEKVFNKLDPAYAALHPAIARAARPYLTAADRATLHLDDAIAKNTDRLDPGPLSGLLLYTMRADARETLYGDDPGSIQRPTGDLLLGLYDLAPLGPQNLGVHYLDATLATLRAARIPVVVFLTPTNHALLHDYIDNASYRANLRYVTARAKAAGAGVLDLDAAFAPREFLDNDHLTAAGQRHLARALEPLIAERATAAP